MSVSLKYAVVERERRWLVRRIPEGVSSTKDIVDRYVTGTRLRLREVREADGTVVRKLGQKVRLSDGPAEVACTNLYLDDAEWAVLAALPSRVLRKRRHMIHRDGLLVVVAEIDDGDQPAHEIPGWLEVVRDVSEDESWTGASLAKS
jgi:hypothetical protein